MIGAQRNENTSVHFKCVFKTRAYLQLARVDRMNADLSSLLLVLCAASADPWAVWQEAGLLSGVEEQHGEHSCGMYVRCTNTFQGLR
jgi:hypothetical protein